MGVKGRRKRERDRAAREAEGGEEREPMAVDGEGNALPPMKRSELYAMLDAEYLEGAREQHARRKEPVKKKQKIEEADLVPAEADAEALWSEAATGPTQVHAGAATISGPRFGHPFLELHPDVVGALESVGFRRMTPIQRRAIPLALQSHDILGQAKTGSGKTLAFTVPIMHGTVTAISQRPGLFVALVLAPTKELCAQIKGVMAAVAGMLPTPFRPELITGGTKVTEERRRLLQCNVAVGTPGRVLDHMQHTPQWTVRKTLKYLVLDEADRLLADGFKEALDSIVRALPPRQTLLFSATNSKSVQELARLSMRQAPLLVSTRGGAPERVDDPDLPAPDYAVLESDSEEDDEDEAAVGGEEHEEMPESGGEDEETIPSSLKQFCQVVAPSDRLRLLYTFMKRVARKHKAMVFCGTVASTTFHCMMMGAVGFHDEVLMLHGKMKHRQRLATFEAFQKWETGVLFCTDVAARGLDIPHVEWILQMDPPVDPTEYVHRIGRTARAGAAGNALLYVAPIEQAFVTYLKRFGIALTVLDLPKLPDIHSALQHVLEVDTVVAQHAVGAFRGYVAAYQSHVLKKIFDVTRLQLDDLAKGFALTSTPTVSLPSNAAEDKRTSYVKGKLKSLNRRAQQARAEYEREKTKPQWSEGGEFVGMYTSIPKGRV